MNQVHWWLFGLSFMMGLILTLSLIITCGKSQTPVRMSTDVPARPEPPTTTIPVAEKPTTKIPVTEQRTTKIPIAKEPENRRPR